MSDLYTINCKDNISSLANKSGINLLIETALYFRFALYCQPGGWLLARSKAEPLLNGRATVFAGYGRRELKKLSTMPDHISDLIRLIYPFLSMQNDENTTTFFLGNRALNFCQHLSIIERSFSCIKKSSFVIFRALSLTK